MTSTELKIGLNSSTRPSSRVLKPPGGGHSNIFAEPEVSVNAPRPKYNQQNSSNLNDCMGSTDANKVVEKLREEITQAKNVDQEKTEGGSTVSKSTTKQTGSNNNNGNGGESRGRIPPGGHSSGGFW